MKVKFLNEGTIYLVKEHILNEAIVMLENIII